MLSPSDHDSTAMIRGIDRESRRIGKRASGMFGDTIGKQSD
jgi:hypothetical protein